VRRRTFTSSNSPKARTIRFFAVDPDGNESVVNFRMEGKYVVIERVGSLFTLRDGNEALCLFNEDRPSAARIEAADVDQIQGEIMTNPANTGQAREQAVRDWERETDNARAWAASSPASASSASSTATG